MTTNHARSSRATGAARLRVGLVAGSVALCVALVAPVASGAAGTTRGVAHASGTVVSMIDGTFGPQLVVGAGQFRGYSLYAITSDTTKTFGCTTKPFSFPGGGSPFPCTGPDVGKSGGQSEWPALTTTAAPVAGPGVTKALLGSVFRRGIGHQVTYAGHPLYLFDGKPGAVQGEGWDEPSLPPWHGLWWLVNPDGNFQAWSQTLTAKPTAGNTVALSAIMMTGDGLHVFPLYSSSNDTPSSSSCGPACARLFPPLLTSGSPGIVGADVTGALGTVTRADGTTQITYAGHPLYLFGGEGITLVKGRGLVAMGNGDNKVVGGGTFNLVTP